MIKLLDIIRQHQTEFDLSSKALLNALSFLESNQELLCNKKNHAKLDSDFKKFIEPLLQFEQESNDSGKPWRVVIDFSEENGIYNKNPIIQLCSGSPSYHRFIIEFDPKGLQIKIDTTSVNDNPDLSTINSQHSPSGARNLKTVKEFYDDSCVQRIAVLGAARVFAHPEFEDEKKEKQKEPSPSNQWARNLTTRVERELNEFLDRMNQQGNEFLMVNGGWAGVKENSTGLPLISHIFGAIADAEQGNAHPPVTIMPEVGSFDRVTTRADAYQSSRFTGPLVGESPAMEDPEIHTYFEIPGSWGDDSKYLVGFSTGLLVFEPYGFWTNIEIANGVAQHKPVAVIVDPDTLKKGGKYHDQFQDGNDFIECKVDFPDGTKGAYRLYKSANLAAKWIDEQSMLNFNPKKDTLSDSSFKGLTKINIKNHKVDIKQITQINKGNSLYYFIIDDGTPSGAMYIGNEKELSESSIPKGVKIRAQGHIIVNNDGTVKQFDGRQLNQKAYLSNIIHLIDYFKQNGIDIKNAELVTTRDPKDVGFNSDSYEDDTGLYYNKADELGSYLVNLFKEKLEENAKLLINELRKGDPSNSDKIQQTINLIIAKLPEPANLDSIDKAVEEIDSELLKQNAPKTCREFFQNFKSQYQKQSQMPLSNDDHIQFNV